MDRQNQLKFGLGGLGVLLGGLGIFLMSDRGRGLVRSATWHLEQAPDSFEQWSDATLHELDRIQQTLNQIAVRLTVAG